MPTMQDVADKAGVSLATVSRVLNNHASVIEEKRRRVEKAIEELGFSPSYFARSLVTKKSGLIGVIVPDISYVYYSIMLSGIEDFASSRDQNILICNIEEKLGKELRYLKMFAEMRVGGIVLMHEKSNREVEDFFLNCDIPVVLASVRPKGLVDKFPSVNIDDFKAAYEATQFLIKKGRKRIALIADDLVDFSSGESRFEGYRAALRDYDLPYDESIVRFGRFSMDDGYAMAKDIFESSVHHPDAVFAVGDIMAIGTLRWLSFAGIKVPSDVAVMGFDDLPYSRICTPQLSTVRQPIRDLGLAAMELLLKSMHTPGGSIHEKVLAHELVEREST